ncbi:MAG: MarC family protein [Oligoflexia bacterium]|nr:MarC family protein [Oligoflexia bacterium]
MLKDFGLSFIAVFVALDIVGTLPLYVSMTGNLPAPERKRIVNTSMAVALVVALIFMVLGEQIFGYLGISLFDFKIAGGLVLLLVSLADLVGQPEAANRASGSTGVVPLAVPLITGPAVLTTLILQVKTVGFPITIAALVVNFLLAWALLRRSETITRLIGKDGTVVFSKIAALLLAAIAVAMMRSGVFEAIAAFRGVVK